MDLTACVQQEVFGIYCHVVEEYHLADVPNVITLDRHYLAWMNRVGSDGRGFDLLGKGDVGCRFDGLTVVGDQTEFARYTLVWNGHSHLFRALQREFSADIGRRRSELLVAFREEHLFHIIQLGTCKTHGCSASDRHRPEGEDIHTALIVLVGIELILATAGKTSGEHQCSHR